VGHPAGAASAQGRGAVDMDGYKWALRPATEADYDFLYRLHVVTMKDYVAALWGWDEAVQQRIFRGRFNPARRQIIVVNGEDAGDLQVELGESELFVSSIHILPEYQGRGIGTAVLRDILQEARAASLPVGLRVLKSNPALRFYERLGFTVIDEIDTHYHITIFAL